MRRHCLNLGSQWNNQSDNIQPIDWSKETRDQLLRSREGALWEVLWRFNSLGVHHSPVCESFPSHHVHFDVEEQVFCPRKVDVLWVSNPQTWREQTYASETPRRFVRCLSGEYLQARDWQRQRRRCQDFRIEVVSTSRSPPSHNSEKSFKTNFNLHF